MKLAKYNEKTIQLHSLSREQFQTIYEYGIKGKLTCHHCGKDVKLYLGIKHSPYFYHVKNDEQEPCRKILEQTSTKSKEEIIEYTVQNGFRIPKKRSITVTNDTQLAFKPFKEIQIKKPFQKKNQTNILFQDHFPLDKAQWNAVTYTDGPLLILAGAGSGKTRVLTARTAYLITEKNIDPSSIMLVTFTSKAAKEMKERLTQFRNLPVHQIKKIVSGTFHSLFYRIISHHEREKWDISKLLKSDWQKEQMLKIIGREIDLDEKEFPFDAAIQQISFWKNTLTLPHQIKPTDQWEERLLFLYQKYEEMKLKQGLFDFDDMLIGCFHYLSNHPTILEKYQQRFNHFLIDEFQDINRVQYEIIRLLSKKTANICVVGDDDQSIYHFRGSDPSFILNFPKDYPMAKIIKLEQNYRSSHQIVELANKVISANRKRHQKKMVAQFEMPHMPILFYPYDEEEEATMIITDIKERIEHGANPNDFAILYRTNTSQRAVFERLAHSSLPFIIEQDSDSFYERFIVKTMISYLRLSINHDDVDAMTYFLSAMFIKKTVLNDLKALSILNDCTILKSLLSIKQIKPFQQKKLQKIIPLFTKLKSLSPLKAIEMIEKEMGFQDFMKKRGNEGNLIERGSDDVRDLKVVAKKFHSIEDFLNHIDHMIAMNKEIKKLSKQYANGIHLTTIHKAKGLEYKYVYLLSAVEGSIPHDFALDANRSGDTTALEEELRLMYVALTRAKEALTISAPLTRRGKKASISRFINV